MAVPSAGPPAYRPPRAHPQRRIMLVGARALVWVLYAYVVVTEVVLTLGFVLLLFGADPDASFVAWAYRSLERAMEPFRGMFTPIELGLSGSTDVGAVLDTSVLFAMLVYAFAAWAVHSLLEWLSGSIRKMDEADRRPAIPPAWSLSTAAMPAPAATRATTRVAAPGPTGPPPTGPPPGVRA